MLLGLSIKARICSMVKLTILNEFESEKDYALSIRLSLD